MTSPRSLVRNALIVLILAIPLCTIAGTALAQAPAPTTAKAPCGAKPEYPGRLVMTSDIRRRSFDREVKNYSECVKAYVEERKAAANANMAAGNAAIEEYNSAIKKLKEDEAAAKRD